MKKELFEQLKQSLREATQIKRDEIKPVRVVEIDPPNDPVKEKRIQSAAAQPCAAINVRTNGPRLDAETLPR